MPAQNDGVRERLAKATEIHISVTGRKSGRQISIPIWFVFDKDLYLLPVSGSDTQWYKNVLQNASIGIEVRGAKARLNAVPVTEPGAVKSVVEKFREKYGAGEVKKYYSNFDAALVAKVP